MPVLLRCSFVLSGKDKFSGFADVLFQYNDGLLKLRRLPVVQVRKTYSHVLLLVKSL